MAAQNVLINALTLECGGHCLQRTVPVMSTLLSHRHHRHNLRSVPFLYPWAHSPDIRRQKYTCSVGAAQKMPSLAVCGRYLQRTVFSILDKQVADMVLKNCKNRNRSQYPEPTGDALHCKPNSTCPRCHLREPFFVFVHFALGL